MCKDPLEVNTASEKSYNSTATQTSRQAQRQNSVHAYYVHTRYQEPTHLV